MPDPIVGSADDYLIQVMTELGAFVKQSTLTHIGIDEHHLTTEARDLPSLLFYYNAVHQRLSLRCEQIKIELDTTEAREFITISEDYRARGLKITVDELKARVTISDSIVALRGKIAEIDAVTKNILGVLAALKQKGYSMQIMASIRTKEDDWLRRSFLERFQDHPNRDKIFSAIRSITST